MHQYKKTYSVFHNYQVHSIFSIFPLPSYLFTVPCSLKARNLYLTQLQTAVISEVITINVRTKRIKSYYCSLFPVPCSLFPTFTDKF
ncbi:hypothetical protein [Moorena producens]|uniref:hypothetical protein n=1 Tax=Moorena producens TaxID=1155739 RepID=UPI003C736A98